MAKYTGYQDKEGKKIFEGDFVRMELGGEEFSGEVINFEGEYIFSTGFELSNYNEYIHKEIISTEDFGKAVEEATKVLGVDPAYYGEAGRDVVINQLVKLGYNKQELQDTLKHY